MNNHKVSLLQLLKLIGKQFDARVDPQLRRDIAADATLAARWRQISDSWTRLQTAENMPLQTNGDFPVSGDWISISRRTEARHIRRAEAIAAFIEGRLDEVNASRIEALCWTRQAWLLEVVYAFHDAHQPFAHELSQVDFDRLGRRLVAMAGELRPASPRVVTLGNENESQETLRESKHPPVSKALRDNFHGSVRYWSAVAAAILLLGVCCLAWMFRSANTQIVQPSKQTLEPSRELNVAEPPVSTPESVVEIDDMIEPRLSAITSKDFEPDPAEVSTNAESEVLSPEAIAVEDWDLILNDPAAPSEPEIAIPETVAAKPKFIESKAVAIPIIWREYSGVMASRTNSEQSWHGLDSSLPPGERFEFAALPASWACGEIGSIGSLTLTENSQIRAWQSNDPSSGLFLNVSRGQVALDKLRDHSAIEVSAGPALWQVLVNSKNSTIAVVFDDTAPRLQVVAGSVLVNGELALNKGDETAWMASHSLTAERTRERPRWISSAPANIRNASRHLDHKSLSRFAVSVNVIRDLQSIAVESDSESMETRMVVARMLMSFEPQQFAIEMLEARNSVVGRETLTWLFSQNSRQLTTKKIWIAIARKTKQPEKVRTLLKWIEMANQGSHVSRETVATMIEWLNDDQILFRQSGHFFLTLAFGNLMEYDAQWPSDRRIVAANRWRSAIAEFNRSRQRRDAGQPQR